MRHAYRVIVPRFIILAPSPFSEIPALPAYAYLHAPALFSMSNRLIWPLDCPSFSLGSLRRYSHSGQSLILQLCTSFRLPPLQSRHLAWMATISSCGVASASLSRISFVSVAPFVCRAPFALVRGLDHFIRALKPSISYHRHAILHVAPVHFCFPAIESV